jgi:hypothetical protein
MSLSSFNPLVNRRIVGPLVLVPLLFMLGGCSLFGIATKGNLKEFSEEQAARDEAQQAQLQQMGEQLRTVESGLQASLAALADENRLRDEEQAALKANMQAAQIQVQAVLADLESLVGVVEVARADSRSAIKMQQDEIYAERERLQQRVVALDALIRSWQDDQPGAVSQQTDPVILRSLVPEQPEQTLRSPRRNDATDASSAGEDETSVWSRNR